MDELRAAAKSNGARFRVKLADPGSLQARAKADAFTKDTRGAELGVVREVGEVRGVGDRSAGAGGGTWSDTGRVEGMERNLTLRFFQSINGL